MRTFQTYPDDLQQLELAAIKRRREVAGRQGYELPLEPSTAADESASETKDDVDLLGDTIGVCLSGGGIRSATFCLGFLQAMARRGLLRKIDWLSTVSGGGYTGAFLGRYYD